VSLAGHLKSLILTAKGPRAFPFDEGSAKKKALRFGGPYSKRGTRKKKLQGTRAQKKTARDTPATQPLFVHFS